MAYQEWSFRREQKRLCRRDRDDHKYRRK
jgi:hypothetical protein